MPLGRPEVKAIKTQQSQEAFYLPFNSVREFRKEAYTSKTVITRDNLFMGETCLHVKANIYLPNTFSSYYPVNCLPPL